MKAEKTAPLLPPCFFCFWLPRANLLAQAKKKEEEHREADRLRKIQEAEACITVWSLIKCLCRCWTRILLLA